MGTVTTLPTAPSRSDPATFIALADAFFDALATLSSELNALSTEWESEALAAHSSLTTSLWVTGTTYAVGDRRFSPTTHLLYRCIQAGVSSTDPASDAVKWVQLVAQGPAVYVSSATTYSPTYNVHVEMTNAAACTVTLPSSPQIGTWQWIGFRNGLTTNVIARNSQPIMGLAEDLTVDVPDALVRLRYVNLTDGWMIV